MKRNSKQYLKKTSFKVKNHFRQLWRKKNKKIISNFEFNFWQLVFDVKGRFMPTFKRNIHFQGPCAFLKMNILLRTDAAKFANFLELNSQKYSQSIAMCPFSKIAKSENRSTLPSSCRPQLIRYGNSYQPVGGAQQLLATAHQVWQQLPASGRSPAAACYSSSGRATATSQWAERSSCRLQLIR